MAYECPFSHLGKTGCLVSFFPFLLPYLQDLSQDVWGKKKALIEKRVSASICYFGHLPCINWFVFFSDQLSLLAFSSVFWFDPCRWLSITQLLSHSLPACVLSTLFCSQIQNMALCVLLWRKLIPSKPDPVHSGKEYSLEIILNILI